MSLDRTFKKCSIEAHKCASSSSLEASSPVHHCSEISLKNVSCKLSPATIIDNLNKNYLNEVNVIPATSLGPVKSKLERDKPTSSKQSDSSSINYASANKNKNHPNQPSSNGGRQRLPSLLQNQLKRFSLTHDDADDEASSHRSEIICVGTKDIHLLAEVQSNESRSAQAQFVGNEHFFSN